jgi:hypothetical protein
MFVPVCVLKTYRAIQSRFSYLISCKIWRNWLTGIEYEKRDWFGFICLQLCQLDFGISSNLDYFDCHFFTGLNLSNLCYLLIEWLLVVSTRFFVHPEFAVFGSSRSNGEIWRKWADKHEVCHCWRWVSCIYLFIQFVVLPFYWYFSPFRSWQLSWQVIFTHNVHH